MQSNPICGDISSTGIGDLQEEICVVIEIPSGRIDGDVGLSLRMYIREDQSDDC
jgi:hypothetical protein